MVLRVRWGGWESQVSWPVKHSLNTDLFSFFTNRFLFGKPWPKFLFCTRNIFNPLEHQTFSATVEPWIGINSFTLLKSIHITYLWCATIEQHSGALQSQLGEKNTAYAKLKLMGNSASKAVMNNSPSWLSLCAIFSDRRRLYNSSKGGTKAPILTCANESLMAVLILLNL